MRQALQQLEREGAIACIRKSRYILPSEADLITGVLSIHQSGFGFLTNEKDERRRPVHIGGEHRNRHEPRPRRCPHRPRCWPQTAQRAKIFAKKDA